MEQNYEEMRAEILHLSEKRRQKNRSKYSKDQKLLILKASKEKDYDVIFFKDLYFILSGLATRESANWQKCHLSVGIFPLRHSLKNFFEHIRWIIQIINSTVLCSNQGVYGHLTFCLQKNILSIASTKIRLDGLNGVKSA